MARKPRFVPLIILTLFLTIGIPSCGGPDYIAIRDIARVDVLDLSTYTFLQAPISTSSDSLVLVVKLDVHYFSFHVDGTMQEAWAFQPPDPIMANEIMDIRVFCDQPIYGHAPQQNLASELLFGEPGYFRAPLEEYLARLPQKGETGYVADIFIFLPQKPVSGTYTFTIEIEDNNGHIFIADVTGIEWL